MHVFDMRYLYNALCQYISRINLYIPLEIYYSQYSSIHRIQSILLLNNLATNSFYSKMLICLTVFLFNLFSNYNLYSHSRIYSVILICTTCKERHTSHIAIDSVKKRNKKNNLYVSFKISVYLVEFMLIKCQELQA